MPIYEYKCDSCHFRFEQKQGFHDKPEAVCPKCQGKAHRVIYPAPVIFKGSGFYVTDSRKSVKEPAEAEKKSPREEKGK